MDIKVIIIETDRQIFNSVCYQLNEKGFRAERVSYIGYCRDKETYASYDLIIYMVGKYDHTDNMPKFSRLVLFVLDQNDFLMQKKEV